MYNSESIDMAHILIRNAKTDLGRDVRRVLEEASKPYDYSNKDFDLTQRLAILLTQLQQGVKQ